MHTVVRKSSFRWGSVHFAGLQLSSYISPTHIMIQEDCPTRLCLKYVATNSCHSVPLQRKACYQEKASRILFRIQGHIRYVVLTTPSTALQPWPRAVSSVLSRELRHGVTKVHRLTPVPVLGTQLSHRKMAPVAICVL